jgi:hypothetical protein
MRRGKPVTAPLMAASPAGAPSGRATAAMSAPHALYPAAGQVLAVDGRPLAFLRKLCGVDKPARRNRGRQELRHLLHPVKCLVIGRALAAPGRPDPDAGTFWRRDAAGQRMDLLIDPGLRKILLAVPGHRVAHLDDDQVRVGFGDQRVDLIGRRVGLRSISGPPCRAARPCRRTPSTDTPNRPAFAPHMP